MYGQQTQFTFDTWKELENNKIDVKLYAEFSAMKSVNIAPNANTSIGWNETNFRTWMSKQEDQKTYLRGAKTIDGDTKAWYNLVIEVPKSFLPVGIKCECHKRDDITQKYMYFRSHIR